MNDLTFEKDPVSTLMWNPLHFAVFHQRLELVKFIVSEMNVGIKITAPKALAEKEKDETN